MTTSYHPPAIGPRRSLLEKLLCVFSRVEPGEGAIVLLLALNAFNMMALYYILKPVREALILSQAGAEIKSYASAIQAVLFIFVVPAYGAFASRVNRVWLLSGMTLFFISNLLLFIAAGAAGFQVGVAYYVWLGIFSFMIVSQFWAFANDLYSEEQGKRLFPIVGIGVSLGGLIGAKVTSIYIEQLGPYQLMSVACGLLGVFALLIVAVNRRHVGRAHEKQTVAQQTLSKGGGFQLVMSDKYLRSIAFLVLLLNLVNTIGEFILGKLALAAAEAEIGAGAALEAQRGAFIGAFYGEFFFWVNLAGFLIQTFLVSRIIGWIGLRSSLFVLPSISAATYALAAWSPVLQMVRFVKTAENSTDYSLNNTVRQALFLITSREAKYKAKAAIDTFFGRSGDALQAAVVFAGTQLSFGIRSFALLNLVFTGIWLLVARSVSREHQKLTTE